MGSLKRPSQQEAAAMGASSENFCLRWNDFESNVSGAFRDLRQEADFFDVTLGCPDGKSLQAHKVILSACSSTFKTMLRDTQRNTNSHHPYIFLRGASFPDLSAVLDFMYHGEVNVAQEDLNSFLAVAEELQIKGLTQKEGGEPSKPKPSGSGAVKRPVQPSSENVSASSTPAVRKIRRSSPDLPEQGQIKTIDIKSDPEAGPSGASQAVNRAGGASADYADESGDFEDYGDYYGEGEGGDNGADGSMMEGGEEGAGGKVQLQPVAAGSIVKSPDGLFVCMTCGRQFKDKYVGLRHHRLVHTPQQRAACNIYNKTFLNEFYRNEHRTREHRITVRMANDVVPNNSTTGWQ